MSNPIIEIIINTCQCDQAQAQEYLDDEIRNLNELKELGDLRHSDLEVSCSNLGLESDYVEFFINSLV